MLGSDGEHECSMRAMELRYHLGHGQAPKLCLRPYGDVISDWFWDHGYWFDCLALSEWWVRTPCPPDRPECNKSIYMDIGANIGACLMQMVSRHDVAQAFAFEPSRSNLFYLTSSILANPSSAHKTFLWPMGLGESAAVHTVYEEPGNAGNSMLDKMTSFASQFVGDVETVTLDSVFASGPEPPPYIHVAKMDVQGFEGKVLAGAARLLRARAVGVWKFEVAGKFLAAQGSSPAACFNAFLENGYTLWDADNHVQLTQEELQRFACEQPTDRDLVASLAEPQGAWRGVQAQQPVHC